MDFKISLMIVLIILANSIYPDEMLHSVAFIHCLAIIGLPGERHNCVLLVGR